MTTTVKCQGTTKAGKQCSFNAGDSGYCKRHTRTPEVPLCEPEPPKDSTQQQKSKKKRSCVAKKTTRTKDSVPVQSNEEEEEEEEKESNIDKEIKKWAAPRNLSNSIRTITTTVAIDTVLSKSPKFDVVQYVNDASRCLGILGVDVSLLANYIAAHDYLLDSLTCMFGDYPFYRSCYDVCVGITANVDKGVLKGFIEFQQHTGYNPRTDLLPTYELNRRPRDAVIQYEIRPAMKRHMVYLATTKLLEYLVMRVEQVLWCIHEVKGFTSAVEFLARRLREHLLCKIPMEEKATPAILKVVQEASLPPEFIDQIQRIVSEVQPFVEKIRLSKPPPKPKKVKTDDSQQTKQTKPPSPILHYLGGIQFARNTVIKMATFVGEAMSAVRVVRQRACIEVNNIQPYVRKSKYWEGVNKYSGFKTYLDSLQDKSDYEPLKGWYEKPKSYKGKMDEVQCKLVKQLQKLIIERRRQLFKQQPDNPGSILLGSSFTLLPVCSLKRDFVNIDRDSLRVWYRHSVGKDDAEILQERNWWHGVFDPYRFEKVNDRQSRKSQTNDFKVIRRASNKVIHVPYLSKSRHIMLNERVYEDARDNKDVRVPLFVSNIRTDGVQVKLLLKTLADCRPAAKHVNLLVKKGYEEIKKAKTKLDIFRDTRGVYDESNVKKLTKAQQELLQQHQRDLKVNLEPNDPGRVEMVTWGKASAVSDPLEFAKSPNSFGSIRSSKYRVMNLTHSACKWEEERRTKNKGYNLAISELSQERLNHNGETLASYIRTRVKHQAELEKELLTDDRSRLRFIRFRAQQRSLRYLARQIAGRNCFAADLKSERRMLEKASRCPEQADEIHARLALREKLQRQLGRLRINVIFFGKGQFGHGRVGPCPRKKLIKKLAELAVVVLLDEFRTSKMCCGACGCESQQLSGSRVLRCQSGKECEGVSPCVSPCPLRNQKAFEIDRDQNAVVNMFRIGQDLLFKGKRPHYLTRSSKDSEELVD